MKLYIGDAIERVHFFVIIDFKLTCFFWQFKHKARCFFTIVI